MIARSLAVTLAGTLCLASAPAAATTVFEEDFTCPIGGEEFESYVIGSSTSWGQRPDGRSYGTLPIYPVVECPGNGFLLFEEEFAPEEIARLEPLVASDEYQAMRTTETPHFRVAWLMEKLGRDPFGRAGALLQASWETDEDADRKARYQTAFVAAATGLRRGSEQADAWFWFNLRAANALRELGEFEQAKHLLEEVTGSTWPDDPDERDGAEFLIAGLRTLIGDANRASEPANLIPPDMAVERCALEAAALSPSEQVACSNPQDRAAIAGSVEGEVLEAIGYIDDGTAWAKAAAKQGELAADAAGRAVQSAAADIEANADAAR